MDRKKVLVCSQCMKKLMIKTACRCWLAATTLKRPSSCAEGVPPPATPAALGYIKVSSLYQIALFWRTESSSFSKQLPPKPQIALAVTAGGLQSTPHPICSYVKFCISNALRILRRLKNYVPNAVTQGSHFANKNHLKLGLGVKKVWLNAAEHNGLTTRLALLEPGDSPSGTDSSGIDSTCAMSCFYTGLSSYGKGASSLEIAEWLTGFFFLQEPMEGLGFPSLACMIFCY